MSGVIYIIIMNKANLGSGENEILENTEIDSLNYSNVLLRLRTMQVLKNIKDLEETLQDLILENNHLASEVDINTPYPPLPDFIEDHSFLDTLHSAIKSFRRTSS